MNNDAMIARAITLLDDTGIVKKDKKTGKKYIEKTFRGQISSFGAAVEMGSLISAVAFFSSKGASVTDRPRLMEAIYLLIIEKNKADLTEDETLLRYIADKYSDHQLKRRIIDAAVAVKLAMNAYELREAKKDGDNSENKES